MVADRCIRSAGRLLRGSQIGAPSKSSHKPLVAQASLPVVIDSDRHRGLSHYLLDGFSNVPSQGRLFACGRLVRTTAPQKSADLLGKPKPYDSQPIPVQQLAEWSDDDRVNGMAGRVERGVNPPAASRSLSRLGFDGARKKSARHEKKACNETGRCFRIRSSSNGEFTGMGEMSRGGLI